MYPLYAISAFVLCFLSVPVLSSSSHPRRSCLRTFLNTLRLIVTCVLLILYPATSTAGVPLLDFVNPLRLFSSSTGSIFMTPVVAFTSSPYSFSNELSSAFSDLFCALIDFAPITKSSMYVLTVIASRVNFPLRVCPCLYTSLIEYDIRKLKSHASRYPPMMR